MVKIALQLWANELAEIFHENYRGDAVIYDSVELALQAAEDSKLDMINLLTIDFLENRERLDLEPVLVGVHSDEGVTERYVIVVRDDSDTADFTDLRGKNVLFGITGERRLCTMWLDVLLMRHGLQRSEDYLRVQSVEKTSQALFPVFFGQEDACLVTERAFRTMAELNPQIANEMRVVARSPGLVAGLMCISPTCTPETRQLILDSSMSLHEKAAGRQILALFGVNRVRRFQSQYLDAVTSLLEEHEQLTTAEQGVTR